MPSRPVKKHKAHKKTRFSLTAFRSAITNGSSILGHDIDHRSTPIRRLRELINAHTSDLGGTHNISEAERSLVRRAAMLELQLEMWEQKFALNDGEATSAQLTDYQRAANSLRRILESVGLQRRAKNVTPTLDDYLRDRHQEAAE